VWASLHLLWMCPFMQGVSCLPDARDAGCARLRGEYGGIGVCEGTGGKGNKDVQ